MNKSLTALLITTIFIANAIAIEPSLDKHLPGFIFPASFEGVLPCADCAGIDTRINLWEDGVFHMQETYLDTVDGDQSFITLGRWHVDHCAIHSGALAQSTRAKVALITIGPPQTGQV